MERLRKAAAMLSVLLHLPIVRPSVLVPVDVLAALFVLAVVAVPARTRAARRSVRRIVTALIALAGGAAVGLALVWLVGDVMDVFGVAFTPITRMWVAFTGAAVALLVLVVVQGGRGRRVLALGAVASVALAAGLGVNVDFGAYKDLAQALDTNPFPTARSLGPEHAATPGSAVVDAASWRAPAGMPTTGRTVSVRIPGTVSHFHARKAVVWLPPAAQVADPPVLPVLISLSGQPGQPSDMFTAGGIGTMLDHYAAMHDGLAPIVVAPDQLGAPDRNPMCVDSRALGRSATYVMTDTTRWIRAHLDVAAEPSGWGILGFSEGATCSMQFSAAHPDVFGTTMAISPELVPVTGSTAHTIAIAFGGSAAAYRRAAPAAIMAAHGSYPGHLTVFAYGQDDAPFRASTLAERSAAVAAGMQTVLIVSPGSAHDWNTVRYALEHGLPTVVAHLGLPR